MFGPGFGSGPLVNRSNLTDRKANPYYTVPGTGTYLEKS